MRIERKARTPGGFCIPRKEAEQIAFRNQYKGALRQVLLGRKQYNHRNREQRIEVAFCSGEYFCLLAKFPYSYSPTQLRFMFRY